MTTAPRRPTLVVDIGNTLVVRSRPGAYRRALELATTLGLETTDAAVRDHIARAVFTGPDPARAAEEIVRRLGLADPMPWRETLSSGEGEVSEAPGAHDLLQAATRAGWVVVAATNSAVWIDPLPPRLASFVTDVVSSSELGLLKQDHQFWMELISRHVDDRRLALVVGDDPATDVLAPSAAGLLALELNDDWSVAALARAIATLGPPPPDAVAVAGGVPSRWGGRTVLEAPNLASLVVRTTRRACIVHAGSARQRATVVRRRDRLPALVLEEPEGFTRLAWVTPVPDRRPVAPPSDLAAALASAGVSLDRLHRHEQRHLVSLVREAKDPCTRQSRIADVVAHLETLNAARGR